MKEIDTKNWNRSKTYEWFKSFTNTTYSMNVEMDITVLVKHVKENKQSFFIDMLYVVVKGLNSVEEMRTRFVNGKVVVYDYINPAFTVMTNAGTFENVREKNCENFTTFYKNSSELIEKTKKQTTIKKENYNPKDCYDEYYITCVPWISFTQFNHPIPDNKESQCIPRICWGKYYCVNERYKIMLNITVSHMFVDGFHLAKAFNVIQQLLNNVENSLK